MKLLNDIKDKDGNSMVKEVKQFIITIVFCAIVFLLGMAFDASMKSIENQAQEFYISQDGTTAKLKAKSFRILKDNKITIYLTDGSEITTDIDSVTTVKMHDKQT